MPKIITLRTGQLKMSDLNVGGSNYSINLLEKLKIAQLVKKFAAFCGSQNCTDVHMTSPKDLKLFSVLYILISCYLKIIHIVTCYLVTRQ
jgi:hypothetical protein